MRTHVRILAVVAAVLCRGGPLRAEEGGNPFAPLTIPDLKGFTCRLHAITPEILPFEPLSYALDVTNGNESESSVRFGWCGVHISFRKKGQEEWGDYFPLDAGPQGTPPLGSSVMVWKSGETKTLCWTIGGMKGDYILHKGQMPPRHVFEEVGAVIELRGCWGPFESDVIQVRVVAPKGADEKAYQKLKTCDVWRHFYGCGRYTIGNNDEKAKKHIAQTAAFAAEFPDSAYAAMANLGLGRHRQGLSDEERLTRFLKATCSSTNRWRALGHYEAVYEARALGRPADAAGHAEQAGKHAFIKFLEASDRREAEELGTQPVEEGKP